jgi:hypothetical protein
MGAGGIVRKPRYSRRDRNAVQVVFYMTKPAWWKRHVVWMKLGENYATPIMKSWSWDRADDFLERLESVRR